MPSASLCVYVRVIRLCEGSHNQEFAFDDRVVEEQVALGVFCVNVRASLYEGINDIQTTFQNRAVEERVAFSVYCARISASLCESPHKQEFA